MELEEWFTSCICKCCSHSLSRCKRCMGAFVPLVTLTKKTMCK